MMEMFGLKSKMALVTGASKNFGMEIATGLCEAGADVIIKIGRAHV